MPPRMGKPAGRTTKKHKEEEETTKTRENQKRKQGDIMDFSHSDSTTSLNNQPESWKCPLSARRHLIPDSATIPSRRRSLRSSKRLIEIGTTCWSRCTQPHKSRELSPATDAIQHLDHAVDTIVSACQSPKGSLVESPSKYLKQVVYPSSTFQPETRNEETEKVGYTIAQVNSRADILEMMEEVGGAEKSLSNRSIQMEGQNTFEVECIPLEQEEPLAQDIQASNKFEKRANKNQSKSNSMAGAGRSSPSFSLKLTEIVNMLDDEDDEIDSVTHRWPKDTVDGYQVRPEFMSILRKIITKHGDIAKNCTSLTMKDRSVLLEVICGIISEMQEQHFSKMKEDFLRSKIALLNDIKNAKMDVEWLHQGLVEMLVAREILEQCGMLKEKKESNRNTIEIAESKLEDCEERKKEVAAKFRAICDEEAVCKETLDSAMDESSRINETVKYVKSKVRRFLNCSPADALL